MRKSVFVLNLMILSVFAVSILLAFYFLDINANVIRDNKESSSVSSNSKPVLIDKSNFAGYLARNEIITNLPKNAVISLKVDSDYYTIGKGSVARGIAKNPDLEVSIPGSYIPGIGDFCNSVKNAINNQDAVIELKISSVSFLWKYRGVVKYRECFGF
ncbi:MAG: hypothetical protein KKE50_03710 [Nanoarchaeota archaeon]|nr:hypothetical protein [Nanoarchaeota archaeon]